jgi:hypothetical protein
LLRLPETCYQLYVRPGDVVFLAKQQLHKLEVDPRTPNAVQTVFTLWTDKLAMQSAKPSQYNDFYLVNAYTKIHLAAQVPSNRTRSSG